MSAAAVVAVPTAVLATTKKQVPYRVIPKPYKLHGSRYLRGRVTDDILDFHHRFGLDFGSEANLLEWHGPASVPLGEETAENGMWYKDSNGDSHIGGYNRVNPHLIVSGSIIANKITAGSIRHDRIAVGSIPMSKLAI